MKFQFSENEDVYQKNKRRGLISRPKFNTKKNTTLSIINNKAVNLHTHCKYCKTRLKTKVFQYLGVCALCDLQ